MKSIVILFAGIFSSFYIDLRFLRKVSRNSYDNDTVTLELNEKKQKLKRKIRKYKNRKYKKRKVYRQKQYKLAGTKAKDRRYSNQKDIRRMHTSYA